MKRWGLIALVGLVAVFAIACGSDDDDAKTPAAEVTSAATSAATAAGTAGATQAAGTPVTRASGELILATTTSTQDSGLLDELVPMFERESGVTVKTVAVGSGQAIEQGSRGDADVLLVHSPAAEKTMVDAGDGIERTLVMHNNFIIVGPKADPAGVKASATSAATANAAMTAISAGKARFISRGDNSGTNALELKLWKAVQVEPKGQSWYEETGQGMGATLQIANQKDGYTISDRATWLAQKANLTSLDILSQGDKALLNVYHVIVVNPARHSDVNVIAARAFAAFMVRADVQEIIGTFGVEKAGEPLFFPDAGKAEPAGG